MQITCNNPLEKNVTSDQIKETMLRWKTEYYCFCYETGEQGTYHVHIYVKYVNPQHGEYLRRGVDKAVINGVSSDKVRHKQYVENDERVYVTTKSLKDNILSLSTEDAGGTLFNYDVRLSFADDGTCTVGSVSDDLTVSGTGKFVKDGEKNSLGGKDRDAIYLDYTVDFKGRNMQYATKDTLVLSTRGVQGGAAFEIEIK